MYRLFIPCHSTTFLSSQICHISNHQLFLQRCFCAAAALSSSSQPVPLAFDAYPLTSEPEKTNPLVILHGLFGHKQNWRGVARALQKELENRVFVVDLRNHGDSPRCEDGTYPSMASDLRHFLEREVFTVSTYKTAFLLGHSMGGKVVAEFALTKSNVNLIEKMIIEDIAPQRESHSDSVQFRAYIEAMLSVDLRLNRSEISKALEPTITNRSIRAFLLTNLFKPRGGPYKWRCNLPALSANLEHFFGHATAMSNGRIGVPTLFLYGANSTYFSSDDEIPLRKMFSQAQFEAVPEAGHWLHSEQPAKFIESVSKFLKRGYFTYDE